MCADRVTAYTGRVAEKLDAFVSSVGYEQIMFLPYPPPPPPPFACLHFSIFIYLSCTEYRIFIAYE